MGREPERLLQFRDEFEPVLEKFLREMGQKAVELGPAAARVHDSVASFTMAGGKRHRPYLMGLAYLGVGGDSDLWQQTLRAACSIELMQSFLLVHDDIMDRAPYRRGVPTVHRVLSEAAPSEGAREESGHAGMSLAILAGNLAMAYGALALTDSDFRGTGRLDALRVYHEVVRDECLGQVMDMVGTGAGASDEAEIEHALKVFHYKTARYTTEGPMHMGACLAKGADEETLKELSSIALPLGNAFQMRDDILDLFGNQGTTGKPVGGDIREGKRTFLVVRTLQAASPGDRDFLVRCLGDSTLVEEDVMRVRDLVERSGALQVAEARCQEWLAGAERAVEEARLGSTQKGELRAYSRLMAERRH